MNNLCVSCGKIIPEGRQLCYACERRRWRGVKAHVIYVKEAVYMR